MTLGHPGIGLPGPIFELAYNYLQELSGWIWDCELKYGYFCYAPVVCETFLGGNGTSYDYRDYDIKITFTTDTDMYLRIPILSLMRNS